MKREKPSFRMALIKIRHRASFPQGSIIAAAGLNCCVRNENRCFPSAMDTEVCVYYFMLYPYGKYNTRQTSASMFDALVFKVKLINSS